jgi:peroxiredoxin
MAAIHTVIGTKMSNEKSLPNDVLIKVPDNLPVPDDDGACNHLPGMVIPPVELISTSGKPVDLTAQSEWIVVYCYPMTGRPGIPVPEGWASTPGAAGCTPQSCGFRDKHDELKALGARVFGMSSQSSEEQSEAASRLRLPYELLSDQDLAFTNALGLPTFEAGGRGLIKRVTLIVREGRVVKYFYPVFPPDQNASEVLEWLKTVKS